jgi:hypothetical protein
MKLLYCFLLTTFSVYSFGQTTSPKKDTPDINHFLPAHSSVEKEFKLDFEGDGIDEIAFSYRINGPKTEESILNLDSTDGNSGIKILKFSNLIGWHVIYEEKTLTGNGVGVYSAPYIEKILNTSNKKEAVLVITDVSGAGAAQFWHLVASVNDTILELDSSPIRKKVFAERQCNDMGYNHVGFENNLVVEKQPCSPIGSCRICFEKPTFEMRFRFTDNAIEIVSVKEIEKASDKKARTK